MRRKTILASLILVALVGGAWFWIHQRSGLSGGEPPSATGSREEDVPATEPLQTTTFTPAVADSVSRSDAANARGEPEAVASAQPDRQVADRVSELQDLAMESDPASLAAILAELKNEEPAIREAAIEAAVQFGSPTAIPRLQQAADEANDPREKSALLEAIDYLTMPTLGEALQTNQPAPAERR